MDDSKDSRNKMKPFKSSKTFAFVYKTANVKIKTSGSGKIEGCKDLVKK